MVLVRSLQPTTSPRLVMVAFSPGRSVRSVQVTARVEVSGGPALATEPCVEVMLELT